MPPWFTICACQRFCKPNARLLLQALMTRSPEELSQPWAKLMCLGLALLFLGKQDATEATLEVITSCINRA